MALAAATIADFDDLGGRPVATEFVGTSISSGGDGPLEPGGLAATYEEWLSSAEYILREGNPHVILCERGIRSYQSGTRATLDLAAIPVMQGLTHLPVLVDPSHASGVAGWIPALGRAAIAAGASGLMVEVHPNPAQALSDGEQALLPQDFARLAADAHKIWGLLHP